MGKYDGSEKARILVYFTQCFIALFIQLFSLKQNNFREFINESNLFYVSRENYTADGRGKTVISNSKKLIYLVYSAHYVTHFMSLLFPPESI